MQGTNVVQVELQWRPYRAVDREAHKVTERVTLTVENRGDQAAEVVILDALTRAQRWRIMEAATDVIVSNGGRLQFGGSAGSLHAITRQVLGYRSQQSSEETALTLTATIQ